MNSPSLPPPGTLDTSPSELSVSMPDLTTAVSDARASPSWTSDTERLGHKVYIVDRPFHRRQRRKDSDHSTLKFPIRTDVVLGGIAGDVHSMTSNFTSSQADISSTPNSTLNSLIGRSDPRDLKSPAPATPPSLRYSLESSLESSASSGVPGFGYYSGKALKWLGERSLNAVDSVIILRRTYLHLARLKRWRKRGATNVSAKQRQKMFIMLGDALEMSRPCYSSIVNKAAAVIARAVDDWILAQFAGPNTKEVDMWLSQIHVCLAPIRLARSHVQGAKPPDYLSTELRNAVSRVPLNLQDAETTSTVIQVLSRELTYSPYGAHHRWLGESLRRIVKQIQQTRPLTSEEITALRDMATRRIERMEVDMEPCRPWEVVLFAECASQSPWCADIVRGHRGLQSLVTSLGAAAMKPVVVFEDDDGWENVDDLLASILSLSRHGWLEGSFSAIPGLTELLLRMLRRCTRERRFRSCTCIVFTLRNLNVHQTAILQAPDARKTLATLAAAQMVRGSSSEEYYRKMACGRARELLIEIGYISLPPSGYTSEADG